MKNPTQYGEVGMAVVVHGKEVDEFTHTDDNTYIWARNGTEYSIVAWNFTRRRVEVVITVDGLSIQQGKVGDYRTQRGYVINANSKPKPIPGFKLDGQSAARFTFGNSGESYAAKMDKPNNIGVIGAAFFIEALPRFDLKALYEEVDSSAGYGYGGGMKGGAIPSSTRKPSIGTAFGREVGFQTTSTSFVRETPDRPIAVLALRYETMERLQEMGVDMKQQVQVAEGPNPFPGVDAGCTPPPGWSGSCRR